MYSKNGANQRRFRDVDSSCFFLGGGFERKSSSVPKCCVTHVESGCGGRPVDGPFLPIAALLAPVQQQVGGAGVGHALLRFPVQDQVVTADLGHAQHRRRRRTCNRTVR